MVVSTRVKTMGVFEIVLRLMSLGPMLVQGSNGNPARIRLGKGRSEKTPAELNKSLPAIISKAIPECSASLLAGLALPMKNRAADLRLQRGRLRRNPKLVWMAESERLFWIAVRLSDDLK